MSSVQVEDRESWTGLHLLTLPLLHFHWKNHTDQFGREPTDVPGQMISVSFEA